MLRYGTEFHTFYRFDATAIMRLCSKQRRVSPCRGYERAFICIMTAVFFQRSDFAPGNERLLMSVESDRSGIMESSSMSGLFSEFQSVQSAAKTTLHSAPRCSATWFLRWITSSMCRYCRQYECSEGLEVSRADQMPCRRQVKFSKTVVVDCGSA